jgi:radical SAM protein with 4Fe4S-binding SPASM domain
MKTLFIDLAMTGQCNMRCSYCSESGKQYGDKLDEKMIPALLNFLDNLLLSDFYKKNYGGLRLGFWGGEPTLKYKQIMEIVEHFRYNDNVTFMMFTNGFQMPDELAQFIIDLKEIDLKENTKFYVQISYDGNPIHDLKRVKVGGGSTSTEVLATINWARENQVPYSLKSTITIDTLRYLYDAFVDVSSLTSGISSVDYFPTLDYFNAEIVTEDFEAHLEAMKLNLKKIASHILKLKKQGKPAPSFKWFESSVASCSAGMDLFVVDVDGRIYACHGTLYTPTKQDHFIQTIYDEDLKGLLEANVRHSKIFGNSPEECKNCEALFCVRCNAVRYSVSNKETYEEKWTDYANRPDLCRVYKEAGLIGRAFKRIEKTIQVTS